MKKLLCFIFLFSTQVKSQSICDSLSYVIQPGQTLSVVSINNSSTSVNFMWMACDSEFCFSDMGDTASFPQVNIGDTVKLCYDAFPCYYCDSLVFIDGSWTILRGVTSIHEITNNYNNGNIYDILGNQLYYIPINKVYIRNNRPYLRILLE
tara:strand:- start:21 stop:473 length:453 start_codon:yes stop_codon:yes gene_type:complete